MPDRLDELIAEAELGEEARNFVASRLGECLVGMARQEAEHAKNELASVNPRDEKKITDLQNRVWRGEKFEEWLVELITRGDQSLEVYKHESQN